MWEGIINANTNSDQCRGKHYDTIRYDTIEEFNVDSKAEYSALSSTRSQQKRNKKKKLKQTKASVPLIQYRLRSVEAVRKSGHYKHYKQSN